MRILRQKISLISVVFLSSQRGPLLPADLLDMLIAQLRYAEALAFKIAHPVRSLLKHSYTPNKPLMDVLKAWSERGIEGAEALVKSGAAPAFSLVVVQSEPRQSTEGAAGRI